MVLWCKKCGALMGLGPPFDDWTTDTSNLCKDCASQHIAEIPIKSSEGAAPTMPLEPPDPPT